MKMILHKFLTTLVLALLTLVLQANAFFPQGRANTKPSNNRRLIGGSASKVIRKRESKQLAQKIEELNDEIEDLTKRSKTRTDWVGGYFQKNPHLDYPKTEPDLSSVPIMDNHCNDQKLQRMQKVKYPEFSWLEDKADPSSRRYVKFYDDISRMGYTNTGRVYSIICPQIGFDLSRIGLCGTFNIEIHVDKTRGWVDEDTRTVCGDLTLYAIVWIDMNDAEKAKYPIRAKLQESFREGEFPFSKEHGTIIRAHYPGKPYEPICPVHNGTDPDYPIPEKRNHFDECYGVGHISTEVRLEKTGRPQHDHLNEILVDVMEIGLPGMLSDGSIVHWNLWFSPPEPVDPEEWRSHTEAMRLSVNDHDGRTSFDKHLAEVEDFDGKPVFTDSLIHMLSKKRWNVYKKIFRYIKMYHPDKKVRRLVPFAGLYLVYHLSYHLLFSDKTNEKGHYLFRPWVYPAVDVGVQFIMMYLATKMTGFPKVYLGGLLCIHLGLIFVSDYGCEGKLAKKLLVGYLHRPLLRIKNWMLNFDKILLSSFFVCSIVFNKHTPITRWMPRNSMPDWVAIVSIASSFVSFWAIPRIDKDPSTSITFGIGKHRYQL